MPGALSWARKSVSLLRIVYWYVGSSWLNERNCRAEHGDHAAQYRDDHDHHGDDGDDAGDAAAAQPRDGWIEREADQEGADERDDDILAVIERGDDDGRGDKRGRDADGIERLCVGSGKIGWVFGEQRVCRVMAFSTGCWSIKRATGFCVPMSLEPSVGLSGYRGGGLSAPEIGLATKRRAVGDDRAGGNVSSHAVAILRSTPHRMSVTSCRHWRR